MTQEAQRIAIAEACGWRKEYTFISQDCGSCGNEVQAWISPSGETSICRLPDYLNDLNAAEPLCQKMHEAGWAVKLTPRYCLWYVYASHKMLGDFEIENTSLATAICEAFLRTLNLWVE